MGLFFRAIDRINALVGLACCWLILVMTLLGALNAILRYIGFYLKENLISNAYTEAQWYLFSAVFLLAAPYVLQQDKHVRVDVLYGKQTKNRQHIINLLGTVLFLLPFCVFGIWSSWDFVTISWQQLEMSSDEGGLARFPVKTLIPIAFGMLFLQGVSEVYRLVHALLGGGNES